MRCRVVVLLLACVCVAPVGRAHADEFRLKDGERIFGALLEEAKGRYKIETAGGSRTIKVAEVVTRIEGDTPHVYLKAARAKLADEDVATRLRLLAYARQHRLDAGAEDLAREVIALDPDASAARKVLGYVRLGSLWGEGWHRALDTRFGPGPRWGKPRKLMMSKYGATAATERAVVAGLDWLAAHQDEDGRIDADGFMKHDPAGDKCDGAGGGHHGERVPCAFDGVTTALAVMAWSGHGSTTVSGPYREQVAEGARFLKRLLSGSSAGFDAIWNHGFALAALADVYNADRDPAHYPVLERATRALLATQGRDGGWRYMGGQIGGVPSTSIALHALALSRQAGVPLPREPIQRALHFLGDRLDVDSGRTEYHDGAERLGYTPTVRNTASALAAQMMLDSYGASGRRKKQVRALLAKKPKWKIEFKKLKAPDGTMREFQIGTLDPYSWFYTTLALRQVGGGSWSSWFGSLKNALLKGQRRDGSAKGSWDPLGNYSNSGGRAFVTGMCCLMLEAPYRLPDK